MKHLQAPLFLAFALSMFFTACTPQPVASPTPSPTLRPTEDNPCMRANIIAPEGADQRANAKAYKVPSNVEISWTPSNCVMTVQYYKNNDLIDTFPNVLPGDSIDIGSGGLGETQIKIWVEGTVPEVDQIWVWVE